MCDWEISPPVVSRLAIWMNGLDNDHRAPPFVFANQTSTTNQKNDQRLTSAQLGASILRQYIPSPVPAKTYKRTSCPISQHIPLHPSPNRISRQIITSSIPSSNGPTMVGELNNWRIRNRRNQGWFNRPWNLPRLQTRTEQ